MVNALETLGELSIVSQCKTRTYRETLDVG
jgi:hypothetical protein